jgi:hypothetical protein
MFFLVARMYLIVGRKKEGLVWGRLGGGKV